MENNKKTKQNRKIRKTKSRTKNKQQSVGMTMAWDDLKTGRILAKAIKKQGVKIFTGENFNKHESLYTQETKLIMENDWTIMLVTNNYLDRLNQDNSGCTRELSVLTNKQDIHKTIMVVTDTLDKNKEKDMPSSYFLIKQKIYYEFSKQQPKNTLQTIADKIAETIKNTPK